ncbi:unnamed protein product [Malus baccata var. baccata]
MGGGGVVVNYLHWSSMHIPRKSRQNAFKESSYKSEIKWVRGKPRRWGMGKIHKLVTISRNIAGRTKLESHQPRPWQGPATEEMKSEEGSAHRLKRLSRGWRERLSQRERSFSRVGVDLVLHL